MMKKLNWSGLDFLRRGERSSNHSRDSTSNSNNSHQLLSTSNLRWSSESRLADSTGYEHVSHCEGGNQQICRTTSRQRASFCDLLGIASGDKSDSREVPSEGRIRGRSGILDTLKRKFNRMARSEHSRLKQMSKRHSISLSVPSMEESHEDRTLPKSQTFSATLTPREPCRLCQLPSTLRRLRKNCCNIQNDLDTLTETVSRDDDNDNILPAEDQQPMETTEEETSVACPVPTVPSNNSNLAWELFKLVKYGWYWGRMTRGEAERKLADQPDGAFLVRDSSDDCHLLSLSFRSYGRTLHTRIEHSNGCFSFYAYPEAEQHGSVGQLIEHLMDTSRSGIFCYSRSRSPGSPSYPVRLTKAVSRFSEVLPLQYMCRFVIRQYVRMDHIEALPLPESLKQFIVQGNS